MEYLKYLYKTAQKFKAFTEAGFNILLIVSIEDQA
jgi:hypothetical protein